MKNKLKQGEALFAEGKIKGAEKCFLEILNEDPKNKEAYNNLGVISFQRQDIEQAIQQLTKSLDIDPFYRDAVLNYCDVLKRLNQFHMTISYLEKIVKKFPDDEEIKQLLEEAQRRSSKRQRGSESKGKPAIESLCGPNDVEFGKLLSSGEYEKIIEIFEKKEPETANQYLAFIVAYFNIGLKNKAISLLRKMLQHYPDNLDALYNMSKIYHSLKRWSQAKEYAVKYFRHDPKNWALNEILADASKFEGDFEKAAEYLSNAMKYAPDDDIPVIMEKMNNLKERISKAKSQKKLAFICAAGLDSFIDDIIEGLSDSYWAHKFLVRSNQEIYQAIDWADIIWFEWANEVAIVGTNYSNVKKKPVILRLHGYESLRKDFLNNIKWDNIVKTIFVAQHVFNTVLQNKPEINKTNPVLIPNGIDLRNYTFKKRNKGFNIAFLGHINYKKNPMMMVQILKKLVDIDRRYSLYWAGNIQDERIWKYLNYILKEMNIANNFHYDGWVEDTNEWLEDKDIFLSTSIHEGYGVAIMEAMAKGIKPIIHNFYVAREFYDNYIFNTVDEAVKMIVADDYDSKAYKEFLEKYSTERQINQTKTILDNLYIEFIKGETPAQAQQHIDIPTALTEYHRPEKNVFDYSTYWNNRLSKDFSVTGVGHISYSPELNKALYADRLYLLDYLIGTGNSRCKSVLEIGPGTGIFTNYFFEHESVKDYLGVDIAKVSVDELTKKFGERFKFQQGDFALKNSLEFTGEKRFDVVFVADVLLHIMSDDGPWQFIANVSSSLKDGGVYIGMEPISFLSKEKIDNINMAPHNRIFRWEELNQCLKKNGLTVEFLIPISFIMNTPFDASRANEIRADALNRLVVESAKKTIKDQEVINTIRFIDKNLIAEHQTGLSEWVVVCRKGKLAGGETLPKSVSYKPLLEQLCTSVENRDKVAEVDNLLKCFETGGYDAGRLIDNFIPYQKRHVEKFVSSEPIEPLTIKTEEISNGTFHIDMLLRNSGGDQMFVQNILYAPQRSFYVSSAFDPLKTYLSNIVSEMKLTTGSQTKIKSYVFDKKLKKDILKNELAYMWERAYPGTQYMHLRGLAVIARRYRLVGRYIEGKDILEAASGFGYGAASFSRQAKSIIALDIAEENIEFGKRTYGFDNISWQQGDVLELPFKSSSFDVYVSFETIEHLKNETIPVYLSEASRVLGTDGVFIVSTPNRKIREGRINNPYHLSEMYYEQLKEYLEKSFSKVHYYSTKSLAIYWGAYPSWADGFIAVCENN